MEIAVFSLQWGFEKRGDSKPSLIIASPKPGLILKKYYLKRNGRAPAGRSEKIFEKPGDSKSVGTADYRLKTADYRLQTPDCKLQTAD